MNIKQLIGQHGKSVALAFSNAGITADATNPKEVIATIVMFPWVIDAIGEQIDKDSLTSLEGDSKGQKAKDTLNTILATILTGAGAFFGAKAGKKAPVLNIPGITPPVEKKQPNWYLIAGVAIAIILTILVIIRKK